MSRRTEKFVMWLVWRLPRWLIYWATIRLFAHATTGKYGDTEAPSLTIADALKRWEDK